MFSPVWWQWVVGGIVLMLLELAVPAFFIIWFGIGAILVGLILAIAPGLSLTTQVVLWTVASIAMTVLWFRVFRNDRHVSRAGQTGSAVGEIGMLTTSVAPFQPGQVRFQKPVLGAEQWECHAEQEIAAGERVRVLAFEGNYVQVQKVN